MIRGIESIALSSQNAKRLARFYRDKVGLRVTVEAERETGEEVYGFEWKKTSDLYIADNPKIKGKNKTPHRFALNFEADDIKKEVKKLAKARVKKIQDIFHIQGYGWVAIFEDPDGNYLRLVQVRPT